MPRQRTRSVGRAARGLAALLLAAGLPSGGALAAASAPLGLCPATTGRLDGFMQAVCAGEAALASGRVDEAIARFRAAAEARRLQATNELAWAGLAAAYCQKHDAKRAREWATRFDEARRLWLGELICDGADAGARRPQPFVHDHMCAESLVADYGYVRNHPDASISGEITSRFTALSQRIAERCSAAPARAVQRAVAKAHRKGPPPKKTKRRVSGRKASPTRER